MSTRLASDLPRDDTGASFRLAPRVGVRREFGEYEGRCKRLQDTCIVDIAVLNASAVEGLSQVFAQLRVEGGRGCGVL